MTELLDEVAATMLARSKRIVELETYERIARNLMALLHRDGGETQRRCKTPEQAYLKAVEMHSQRLQEQFDEGVRYATSK